MKTISEVAKMLNVSSQLIYQHVKRRGYTLSKNDCFFWRLNKYQFQLICEELFIEYITLPSKMNDPKFDLPDYSDRKDFIKNGNLIPSNGINL